MTNKVKSLKTGENNLLFDFSVNKENKTILIKKEFAANLQLVWDAWTKSELLDKWWAPPIGMKQFQ